MKKFFIILNVVYFVVFWIGVGLISIDEHVVLGASYVLYIIIGVFINVFGGLVYSENRAKK